MSLAHRTGDPRRRDPAPVSRRARAWVVAALLATLAVSGAGTARAALLYWTLSVSPTTVTAGTVTNFTLNATTDPLGPIKCIVIDVPVSFDVLSVTAGGGWSSSGSAGNQVRVSSSGGIGGLLRPLSTSFTVRAEALSAGQVTWQASAYPLQGCSGAGPLLGSSPTVRVLLAPTPAPTVTPAPTPGSTATPAPTATPWIPLPTIPLPSIGSPLPSIVPQPSGTAAPTSTPRPTVGGTSSPRPSATPRPTTVAPGSGPIGPGSGGPSGSSGGGASRPTLPIGSSQPDPIVVPGTGGVAVVTGLQIAFDPAKLTLDLGGIGLSGNAIVWAVPAATLGAPGLLILLWVALQTGGALIWTPAVRRLRRLGAIPGITKSRRPVAA